MCRANVVVLLLLLLLLLRLLRKVGRGEEGVRVVIDAKDECQRRELRESGGQAVGV